MTPIEFKQKREALGLTQQQLADKLGLGVRTIKRWESKKGYKAFGELKYGPSDKGIVLMKEMMR